MLYDQGQLLRTYTETWRRTGCHDEDLLWPVRETADYLRREMAGPEGGYFASQDADSEGEEGKFYVWEPEQVHAVLGPERGADFCEAYAVTPQGSFEHGTSVLCDVRRAPRAELAAQRAELCAARARRVPPATDRKRVTAWNGLAISGLARAGSLLGDDAMLRDAAACADFLLERLHDPQGRLLRVFDAGRAQVEGFLDDHAALLEGCLDLFRAGAGERFLGAALRMAGAIAERFFDPGENDLFLTQADGERLPHRPRSDHDGATPHSTGQALLGMLRTASLAGRADLARVAERVLRTHAFALERAPAAYPTLLRAAALAERGLALALVIGRETDTATHALAARARRVLAPEDGVVVVAPGGTPPQGLDPTWLTGRETRDGRATAYLCRGTTCSLPITDPEALR
jgi:hypothetical protein